MPALRWASCCSPSSCWRPKVFPGSLDAAAMLELRGVSKRFGGVVATDDVTLEVTRGEVHALIGPNGAGKTTLIGQIAGVLATESGLWPRMDAVAAPLAHGERRALEVGLALATQPQLVLLDEPMAGMGPEDSQAMIALIAKMRERVTVLLVEHDMDAVFRLANRISVLVNGRVIATGAPAQIRADAQVRKAYLGEELAA